MNLEQPQKNSVESQGASGTLQKAGFGLLNLLIDVMEGPSSASLKLMLAGLVGCEGEATLLTFFPAPRLSGSDLLPHEMTAAALGSEALQRSAC